MKASAVNRCVCAGFEPAGIRCPGKPEVIHPKPYPTGAPHGALFYIPVSYVTAALPSTYAPSSRSSYVGMWMPEAV